MLYFRRLAGVGFSLLLASTPNTAAAAGIAGVAAVSPGAGAQVQQQLQQGAAAAPEGLLCGGRDFAGTYRGTYEGEHCTGTVEAVVRRKSEPIPGAGAYYEFSMRFVDARPSMNGASCDRSEAVRVASAITGDLLCSGINQYVEHQGISMTPDFMDFARANRRIPAYLGVAGHFYDRVATPETPRTGMYSWVPGRNKVKGTYALCSAATGSDGNGIIHRERARFGGRDLELLRANCPYVLPPAGQPGGRSYPYVLERGTFNVDRVE